LAEPPEAGWFQATNYYRAQRKPTKMVASLFGGKSWTASGPAPRPKKNAPPRTSAPGKFEVVLAPARHISSSLKPPQPGQFGDAGPQPAPPWKRFPPMSKAPRAETQWLRAPVMMSAISLARVLQSVAPLSAPGSGVPFAAPCHSALVGSRLPEFAQAS